MREQDDIPRLDGLRHDDPPFRSNFTEQPMKSEDVLVRQRREYPPPVRDEVPAIQPEQLIPKDYAEETVMNDTQDVIALINKVAAGGQYVKVDKLIEALKCI